VEAKMGKSIGSLPITQEAKNTFYLASEQWVKSGL